MKPFVTLIKAGPKWVGTMLGNCPKFGNNVCGLPCVSDCMGCSVKCCSSASITLSTDVQIFDNMCQTCVGFVGKYKNIL